MNTDYLENKVFHLEQRLHEHKNQIIQLTEQVTITNNKYKDVLNMVLNSYNNITRFIPILIGDLYAYNKFIIMVKEYIRGIIRCDIDNITYITINGIFCRELLKRSMSPLEQVRVIKLLSLLGISTTEVRYDIIAFSECNIDCMFKFENNYRTRFNKSKYDYDKFVLDSKYNIRQSEIEYTDSILNALLNSIIEYKNYEFIPLFKYIHNYYINNYGQGDWFRYYGWECSHPNNDIYQTIESPNVLQLFKHIITVERQLFDVKENIMLALMFINRIPNKNEYIKDVIEYLFKINMELHPNIEKLPDYVYEIFDVDETKNAFYCDDEVFELITKDNCNMLLHNIVIGQVFSVSDNFDGSTVKRIEWKGKLIQNTTQFFI